MCGVFYSSIVLWLMAWYMKPNYLGSNPNLSTYQLGDLEQTTRLGLLIYKLGIKAVAAS